MRTGKEIKGIFTDLLSAPVGEQERKAREGMQPDLEVTHDGVRYIYDVKTIHYNLTRYPASGITGRGTSAVELRARAVDGEYTASARKLDDKHFSHIADPDQRDIIRRLREYPLVHGLAVGAFGEMSPELHALLQAVAASAAEEHWRTAGAASVAAALSGYTSMYRRRWSCEAALQGARLRLTRARLVVGAPVPGPRAGPAPPSFDPASHVDFGAACDAGFGGGTHRRRAATGGGGAPADAGGD